jgi:hypothetical protein
MDADIVCAGFDPPMAGLTTGLVQLEINLK